MKKIIVSINDRLVLHSGNFISQDDIKNIIVLDEVCYSTVGMNVYDVYDVPSDFIIGKYLYYESKGFLLNPLYVEPIIIDGNIVENSTLEDIKNLKKQEMINAYQTVAFGTFVSTAYDGVTPETYDISANNQVRINGEVTIAIANLQNFTTEEVSWMNVSQPQCVPWNPQSMINLGADLHKFETEKQEYLDRMLLYIDSLTTIEDVNNVIWSMEFPN